MSTPTATPRPSASGSPADRRRRWATAALAAGLVASAAACSGSSGSSGSSGNDRSAATTASGAAATSPPATSSRAHGVPVPTVSRPPAGQKGKPFNAMPAALAQEHGYVEDELIVSGTASAYKEAAPFGTDGKWSITPTTTAPYTTRVIVRRPADPAKSDGTAVVEWLNVSSGQDSDVDWAHAHDELMAHGTTWVGVSTQAQGVQGGAPTMAMPGVNATPLKTWDPERYAALDHPGDDYSYDIFSQVGAALRGSTGRELLGDVTVDRVIAAGESQSGARMVTYLNAVQPVADVYDGFFVHSRSDGGSSLYAKATTKPEFAHVRDDLGVPVLQVETETDLFGLPFVAARQPDTDHLRTWEVAGTAHLDKSMLEYFGSAAGAPAGAASQPVVASCGTLNDGPQTPVVAAGFAALRRWITDGTPPPKGTPIETTDTAVVRDDLGLAKGGIRTPPVDAPTEVLRGDSTGSGYVCMLFGSSTPIDPATLAARYPSHQAYVDAVTRSAQAAAAAGFLRQVDADAYVAQAQASTVGG